MVKVPQKIYFKPGSVNQALQELKGKSRAFIITDAMMVKLGHVGRVTQILEATGIQVRTFSEVEPDPDLANVQHGHGRHQGLQPRRSSSLWAAWSVMDAAKIMWLFYENP